MRKDQFFNVCEVCTMDMNKRTAWRLQVLCTIYFCLFLLGLVLQFNTYRWSAAYWVIFLGVSLLVSKVWLRDFAKPVLTSWWEMGRKEILRLLGTASAAVVFSTVIAHGFLFANEFYSHDSIGHVTYAGKGFSPNGYIAQGRFLIPYYEVIKGDLCAPWLVGLLFTIWCVVSAVLMIDLFNVRSTARRCLIGGLICTNMSLSLTGATYIYCMDEYALALLASVAAAWLFCRSQNMGGPLGICCIVVSLALYQPYFTVTLAICFLYLIRKIVDNEDIQSVIRSGVRYLVMAAIGFVAYYILWSGVAKLVHVSTGRTEESLLSGGLSHLPKYIMQANKKFFEALLNPNGVLGGLFTAVGILTIVMLLSWTLRWLLSRELHFGNKILLLLAMCLLPTALNSIDVLLLGDARTICTFGREMIYLLLLLSVECPHAETLCPLQGSRFLAMGLVVVVLWQNILFANHLYVKKELEKTSTLVVITRVVERIERTEGYVPGETPVAFVGCLSSDPLINKTVPEFKKLAGYTGMWNNYADTGRTISYIQNYLNYPIIWDNSKDFSSMEEVQKMPVFPTAGSVQMIDGTVVVKFE